MYLAQFDDNEPFKQTTSSTPCRARHKDNWHTTQTAAMANGKQQLHFKLQTPLKKQNIGSKW